MGKNTTSCYFTVLSFQYSWVQLLTCFFIFNYTGYLLSLKTNFKSIFSYDHRFWRYRVFLSKFYYFCPAFLILLFGFRLGFEIFNSERFLYCTTIFFKFFKFSYSIKKVFCFLNFLCNCYGSWVICQRN